MIGLGQEASELRAREFWALEGVSFHVGRGEAVGLIGHNGAGKTTLLKLINGLIKPTQGSITVDGSLRALIALGTGFNPVLTGRENIRIASAVLGFHHKRTADDIDEIIEFSEIGDFIDTPIQSYSSGMLARLGFAVAVHTSPDILLVDEVLAVGDMGFSIKCYRKIAEFRNQGGSIVLVSHSPYTIRTNCDRVVWIEHGSVQAIGDAQEVCDEYELAVAKETGPTAAERREYGDGTVRVVAFDYPASIATGEGLSVTIELEATRPVVDPIVAVGLAAVNGQTITANDSRTDQVKLTIREGAQTIKVTYPALSLRAGIYTFSMMVAERIMTNSLVTVPNCGRLEVTRDARDHGAGILSVKPVWWVP